MDKVVNSDGDCLSFVPRAPVESDVILFLALASKHVYGSTKYPWFRTAPTQPIHGC